LEVRRDGQMHVLAFFGQYVGASFGELGQKQVQREGC